MPAKVFHSTNPMDMAKWDAMPRDRDFYVILHNAVGSYSSHRQFRVKDMSGFTKKATESFAGEPLHQGSIVPAKDFGPGVDLQRLVDLGAIREATPWEIQALMSDLVSENPGRVVPEGFVSSLPARDQTPIDSEVTDDLAKAKESEREAAAKLKEEAEKTAKTDEAKRADAAKAEQEKASKAKA